MCGLPLLYLEKCGHKMTPRFVALGKPSIYIYAYICIVPYTRLSIYLAQNLKVASTGFNHVIFLRILCKYVLSIAQAKRHASCYVLISITCARPFIFSFTQQQAVYF